MRRTAPVDLAAPHSTIEERAEVWAVDSVRKPARANLHDPYDDHIDRTTYFERCWRGPGTFEYHNLKHVFVKRNECFVLYESTAKDGNLFRNTEFFRLDGRQIQSVEFFFGLPPKRKGSTHTGGSSPVNGRSVRRPKGVPVEIHR